MNDLISEQINEIQQLKRYLELSKDKYQDLDQPGLAAHNRSTKLIRSHVLNLHDANG